MAILSYLNWECFPIARLTADPARERVVADLEHYGVSTTYMSLPPRARTPVVIERIRRDANGIAFHSYSFSCPTCGGRLPGFQPVPVASIEPVKSSLRGAQVLLIDRVSRSALTLAQKAQDFGVVIVFEPSSIRNRKQFREILQLSHIVKYSQDRLFDLGDVKFGENLLIEIQTLGRGGIRFRTRLDSRRFERWHHLDASPVARFRDAAGAGDWFSAGLINSLCRKGLQTLLQTDFPRLSRVLGWAQSLAAWNCGFIGARGGMYSFSAEEFQALLGRIQAGTRYKVADSEDLPARSWPHIPDVCARCVERRGNGGFSAEPRDPIMSSSQSSTPALPATASSH